MSEPVAEAMTKIRQFMFERVYKNPIAKSEEGKAEMLMETLYQHFLKHLDDLPEEYLNLLSVGEPREKVVCDYVGAMTDRFAIAVYELSLIHISRQPIYLSILLDGVAVIVYLYLLTYLTVHNLSLIHI